MDSVLVILLSLVLVVLGALILIVARLAGVDRRSLVALRAPAPRRAPGPVIAAAAVATGGDEPALDDDGEPMVRVLPAGTAGAAPAASDASTVVADAGGAEATASAPEAVTEPARASAPEAVHEPDPAAPGEEVRAKERPGVAAEATQVLARAEREVRERLARAEREAAAVRRRGEEEAAALRDRVLAQARAEAARVASAAREELAAVRAQAAASRAAVEDDQRSRRAELARRESELGAREQRVEQRGAGLDEQATGLAERERELREREAEIARRAAAAGDLEAARQAALERIADLTAAEARAELVTAIEHDARREATLLVREIEARAEEEGEQRARRIVTTAIQRVASEQTTESVVTVLHLPGDEMKGRIIGREGRNIRAFESVTGVNVLIDDTPEAVLLSCFDPVRREIGRITLAALVSDGRIHPHRIEEEYARAQVEVEERCVRAGEDALVETGVSEMHPELVTLLGRLRYRTSYGQNVLAHLIESAHLAGIMAAELRMALPLAKRAALLHDLGKALTHEVEGSHALIGADMARRHGESEEVVHAIEAHHNEVAPRSLCAVLTQAADQISGGRPGARRDSLESYVKRLERIEQIAGDRPGVDRVFAMQAGREVRVMVVPEQVDDAAAHLLARDVARQIEDELTYPGQIRVTVVRETRAVGMAR
ncbi:Ribonuclease Y [Frankia canadensis]|uniref:Ribonuclease Y n=1 Tax=Frankia canadensis TaxID=1836972 RepID=A0A2I2KTS8_9ACTN|nr:ribonuclease Y [Frankia canadensis]SNQ49065.1 Ribonuclease Y [Frankia canadensis]SOU56355.1 Ribonuclease Y [Frankia canadensis]